MDEPNATPQGLNGISTETITDESSAVAPAVGHASSSLEAQASESIEPVGPHSDTVAPDPTLASDSVVAEVAAAEVAAHEAPAEQASADETPAEQAESSATAAPKPAPRAPTPPASPAPSPATPATASATAESDMEAAERGSQWGRVGGDGTVFLITGEGEREIGSYPDASAVQALAYFARKYDDLAAQVTLLEQRVEAGQLYGTPAVRAVEKLGATIPDARVLGDLQALTQRLADLVPKAQERKDAVDSARAQAREQAISTRRGLVEEAEQIAETDPERMAWKGAGERLRQLFDEWKVQQRQTHLDRASEDELWRRFSHARTTFDRKRRQHFGALDERRNESAAAKSALVTQAEALSKTTDWNAGARQFRDLMTQWKAAGRAGRREEEQLWERFRAAQDAFFAARNAVSAELDAEQQSNLEAKLALLTEAEALLPVSDLGSAKASLRSIQDRWDAAGKVPRSELARIEARMRAVEQAIRAADESQWRRTNPEGLARAQDAVAQLESAIAALQAKRDKAVAAGNTRGVADAEAAIEARTEWLEQARRALEEFGG